VADGQHGDDRPHADDDAEQGERGAEEVRAQRAPGRFGGFDPGKPRRPRALSVPARQGVAGRLGAGIAHDQAVADLDHAPGVRRDVRRVRDHDDRVALP
jgi:hypothetical protein